LKSYKQLISFANNVSPSTLEFVESLSIVLGGFKSGLDGSLNFFLEESPTEEPKMPAWLKDSTIIKLFKNLPSVETLAIAGSSRLARLVLHPSVASTCFPELCELRLRSSFEGLSDPYHPAHLSSLDFYTDLIIFEYAVYRKASTIRPSSKPVPHVIAGHGAFLDLSIRGPLSASLDFVRILCTLLQSVHTLILDDSSPDPQITDLLRNPNPDRVQHLILSALNADDPTSFKFPLLPCLLGFKKLEHLTLFGALLPPTMPSYRRLKELPLESIQFGRGSHLSTKGLINLLTGPLKITTLKTLVLDNVVTQETRRYAWSSPRYTEEFTRPGFKRLIELGKVEGVDVVGEAVDAIEVAEEMEEELEEDLRNYQALAFIRNIMSMTRFYRLEAEEEEDRRSRRRAGRGRGSGRGRGRGRGQN